MLPLPRHRAWRPGNWVHFLAMIPLLACIGACVPQGRVERIEDFVLRPSLDSDSTVTIKAGEVIQAPHGHYEPFEIRFSIPVNRLPDGPHLFFKSTTFAWELWHDRLLLGKYGSIKYPVYIGYQNSSLADLPESIIPAEGNLELTMQILPDEYPFRMPVVSITDRTISMVYANRLIPLNREFYRSVSTICLFLSVYLLIYFFSRRRDFSALLAAIFNIIAFAYFYGMSQSWEGMPLPLVKTFVFFKAIMIPGFVALGFYLETSYRSVRARPMVTGFVLSLALAVITVLIPASLNQGLTVFGLFMAPVFVWLVIKYIQMVVNTRHQFRKTWALIIGAGASILTVVHDYFYVLIGQSPDLWLQGVGIFCLQFTLFATLAFKSAESQNNLESYTVDVEDLVRAKTSELEKLNQELRAASQAKTAFLAHMSHEIRTPLNSIMGFTQLLLEAERDSVKNKQLGLVIQESHILLDLINEILDVSRIEGGKLKLDAIPFSPLDVFTYSVDSLGSLSQKRSIRLEFRTLAPLPPLLVGDSLRLQQVLHNLLGNAIKFTIEGSVNLEVTPYMENNGVILSIVVRDTGIGIPADKLDRIFQSFEQVDTSITRRFGGSGLGLTIVRELVRLMNGNITLESVHGKGTTVKLDIPFQIPDPLRQEVPRPANAGLGEEAMKSLRSCRFVPGTKILAVEDYEPNVQLLRLFLEPLGANLEWVADGISALEWLKTNKPQLIFMDLHMPDMDGYETSRRIRDEFGALADVPIIALTADAWNDVHKRCLRSGMQDVVTKPLSLELLINSIYTQLPICFEVVPQKPVPAGNPSQGPQYHEWSKTSVVEFGNQELDTMTSTRTSPSRTPQGSINVQSLAQHFAVEEEDVVFLVDGFFSAGERIFEDLEQARRSWDLETIHLKAHALKGGALNIQAHTLADAALLVEKAAKNRNQEGLDKLMDQMTSIYHHFRTSWTDR